MISCLNCGNRYEGKYCPECGQKSTVAKLTWKTVASEFIHFFTHAEHSFIYTSKKLLTAPAGVMKDFLEGKRQIVHKPITFLLIWVALDQLLLRIYNYCTHQFQLYQFPESASSLRILWTGPRNTSVASFEPWATLLIQAPLLVLLGWLIFRKTKTSFIERWVIMLYGIAASIILTVFLRAITFLFRLLHIPVSRGLFNDLYFVLYVLLVTWVVYHFLKLFRPQMSAFNKILIALISSLAANYASEISFYLLYRFSA